MDHQHHGHLHSSDSGDGDGTCPMTMFFHGGHCEYILWKGWITSTTSEFLFSSMAIFIAAFVYEFIKFVREYYACRAAQRRKEQMARSMNITELNARTSLAQCKERPYLKQITNTNHLLQTILHTLQVTISYMLMLVVMTFNYWLLLAVVMGITAGYFFFGWVKSNAYDTDCCG